MLPIELAKIIAQEAGIIMKRNFLSNIHTPMDTEWKDDNTPVTITDLAINALVLEKVSQHFPDHSILSEEGSLEKESDYVWVCDPVDGTLPFSRHIPTSVFSIALTYKGEVILGVVLDPFLDRLFYAEKGKGAFLNDKQIHVSKAQNLENQVVGIYLWSEKVPSIGKLSEKLLEQKTRLIDAGSIIYMGCLVASGELVSTITIGKKPHDSASLKIIIEEAGGRVTSILGADQLYNQEVNGHISSNGLLHDTLVKITKEAF